LKCFRATRSALAPCALALAEAARHARGVGSESVQELRGCARY
jgi:hypothetical protein